MKNTAVIFLFVGLLASCSVGTYVAPRDAELAKISLSKRSVESPSVLIISGCKYYKIEEPLLERKNPYFKPKTSKNILAGQSLGIEVSYSWLGDDITEIVPNGTFAENSAASAARRKEVKSCKKQVFFTPKQGAHYEILYGVAGDACVVDVYRAIAIPGSVKQDLGRIKTEDSSGC